MDLINAGYEVLYVWESQNSEGIESQVLEMKKIAKVQLENLERLEFASYEKSTFDIIFVNVSSILSFFDDSLKVLLKFVKPKGKIIFNVPNDDNFTTRLILLGFVNVSYNDAHKYLISEKPNYEVGSRMKLSFKKKEEQPSQQAQKVWKIDLDDEDEEMIEPDDLLDEEDKQKPEPESLRVCSTTGKRKACKDCSCGLAEELEAESNKKIVNPTQKSSCGSCYLGDAFRCSSCPYLGMPAFKPNEKVILPEMMKSDI